MNIIPPFSPVGLTSEEAWVVEKCYLSLFRKYEVDFMKHNEVNFRFRDFALFKDYLHVSSAQGFHIRKGNDQVRIFFPKVQYILHRAKGGPYEQEDLQAWGYLELKKDFGHVLIKRETFSEKIAELITPVELDFPEDATFSKKYYVLTNDREKTKNALDEKLRQALLLLNDKDIMIEILNNRLVVGIKAKTDPERVKEIAGFLLQVVSIST